MAKVVTSFRTIRSVTMGLAMTLLLGVSPGLAASVVERVAVQTSADEGLSSTVAGFDTEASIDSLVELRMAQYHLPGVAVGIIKGDSLIFARGYGWADLDNRVEVTDSTIFMLASISKTFVGVAMMQLVENGTVGLHDEINDHLPFAVYNPNHPASEITVHQLLTHTSGLDDNWEVMNETYVPGDSPIPLDQYVQDYFLPEGVYYDSAANFKPWAPGSLWSYSNHGIALAAYLVQAVTGQPFEDYCQDSIFDPMGMPNSSWHLAGMDVDRIALPYSWTGSFYKTPGHFGYADWPAGQLRTNVHDLAKQLVAHLQLGQYEGYRLLDSVSVVAMTTVQAPVQSPFMGLTWFQLTFADSYGWDHSGGDIGVSTRAGFRFDDSTGVIVLSNGSGGGSAIGSMIGGLFAYAHDYPFIDTDGDGVYDPSDNCASISNTDQADQDGDRIGDLCDLCPTDSLNDPDQDGICNSSDNCPDLSNPEQIDTNTDGIGDACCCGRFTNGYTGNIDCSTDGNRNLADITRLIDRVYISQTVLCCEPGGDIDGDPEGKINLADITRLIDHVYLSKRETAACY